MSDKSPAITALRWVGRLLPGDYLKTAWYLYFFGKLRRTMRLAINGFYRMEHVYDVLQEAKRNYKGKFSILEFGTNEGYALTKMLYATRFLKMEDRVMVHGFDTFEGMPASEDPGDKNILHNDWQWVPGQFDGKVEKVDGYLKKKGYSNYGLHKGLFQDTLTDEFLETLKEYKPILVWVDCDYYTSARAALEPLIPYLPTGCVVFFDEIHFNFHSRFTGEARVLHELNRGDYGDNIELTHDFVLSLDCKRVWRFVRFDDGPAFERAFPVKRDPGRAPTNGSILP